MRIGRCLFKALMPTWDEAQAQQSAEDDWEQDAKGKPTIDRRGFGESMFQVGSRPAAAVLPSALVPPPRRRPSPRAARSWPTCGRRAPTPPSTCSSWVGCLSRRRTHRRTAAPPHRRTAAAPRRRTAAPPPCAAPLRLRRYTCATSLLHLCSATAQAGDVHARRCVRVAR